MSDRDGLPTTMEMDDLELVTRYLNQQLDPVRAEQVRVRLETDRDFYYLAEPLLFVWSVPRHLERHPRPAGELERHWDEFTKRAGFTHQRRKTRRLRLRWLAIVLMALVPSALFYGKSVRTAYRDWRDYGTVNPDTGWVALDSGLQVQLAPDAKLRAAKQPDAKGVLHVKLQGSARFRIFSTDTAGFVPAMQPLVVETRGGIAFSGMGEFTVATRGDTTDVEVHRPSRRRFLGFMPVPSMVLVETAAYPNPISLHETQRARLVRGGRAERTNR